MSFRVRILEVEALIKAFTFFRLVNALKVSLSYFWSRVSRRVLVIGKPIALGIEPTSICNLQCPECPTGANLLKRPRGSITVEHYRAMVNQLSAHLIYLNLYIQGEPFMHPQFEELVRIAAKKKIYTSTSTNGHFIDRDRAEKVVKAGLRRIIFSLDGATQATYSVYRIGGDIEKVIAGIEHVLLAKRHLKVRFPIVVLQFLVFKHNEHELSAIRQLAYGLGVDKLEIKTAQFNDFGNGKVEPPSNILFSRYRNHMTQELKNQVYNHCWRQWHSAVVTWDGQVSPCCYDKDAEYYYGNVFRNSSGHVFGSEKDLKFKKTVLLDKGRIKMCNNCPEGRTFWL